MKLMAGRQYKNDLSDIVGILNKNVLIDFQNNYSGVLNEDNLADILKAAKAKKQKLSSPKSSEGNGWYWRWVIR